MSGATSARLGDEGESLWTERKHPCLIRGPTGRPAGEQRGRQGDVVREGGRCVMCSPGTFKTVTLWEKQGFWLCLVGLCFRVAFFPDGASGKEPVCQ